MSEEILQMYPLHPAMQARLDADFTVHRWDLAEDRDALLAEIGPRIRCVVTDGGTGMPKDVADRLPALEFVGNVGVGYDQVDVPAMRARGVRVTHTPGVLDAAVAELTLALMLAHARRIPENDAFARAGRWEVEGLPPFTAQLAGAKAGILGLGRIGKAIASRCAAMGMEIAYHGRSEQPDVPYAFHPTPEGLAKDVDWLIAVAPATPETRGIVSRDVLTALGPEGTFVNVGRGALHDEAAMIELIESGALGGAALDVFADEPRIPQALRGSERVTLSPHMGSATHPTRTAMAKLILDNLDAHLAGRPLLTEVPE